MSQAERMLQIFAGNPMAHGRSVPKDGDPRAGGMRVDAPYTVDVMREHLAGKSECGVYPVWHNSDGELVCSVGCCDIDTGGTQAWAEAYALVTALKAMGLKPQVERSRSKGFHVWIFSDGIVTARSMRRALKVAYAAIELPAKEANPKSEQLKPGAVGNYIRVPYFNGGTPYGNQMFLVGYDADSPGMSINLDDWLYEFDASHLTDYNTIIEWGDRFKEPERKHIVSLDMVDDQELQRLVGKLPGDLMLFVKNGPQHDRSGGLVALAHKLRSQGYTAKEIYSVITVAHQIWGSKYGNRSNPEAFLTDIVERAVQ